jgi:hypothetical protein
MIHDHGLKAENTTTQKIQASFRAVLEKHF